MIVLQFVIDTENDRCSAFLVKTSTNRYNAEILNRCNKFFQGSLSTGTIQPIEHYCCDSSTFPVEHARAVK